MSLSAQEFVATTTQKVAADLEEAFLRIPVEKRNWVPQGESRTAIDQLAEIAMLNGSTADLIRTKTFAADFDMKQYIAAKTQLTQNPDAVLALFHENTPKVVAAIREVADADLNIAVPMPWGTMTLTQIIGYPLWNMSYHEGQINYIASMLGCLD